MKRERKMVHDVHEVKVRIRSEWGAVTRSFTVTLQTETFGTPKTTDGPDGIQCPV